MALMVSFQSKAFTQFMNFWGVLSAYVLQERVSGLGFGTLIEETLANDKNLMAKITWWCLMAGEPLHLLDLYQPELCVRK